MADAPIPDPQRDRPEEVRSSRITPEDAVHAERRSQPRRAEDRERIAALRRRYNLLRAIAIRAAIAWAVVATAAAIALFVQGEHSASASHQAARAAVGAEQANQRAARAYAALLASAAGECYRVDYLRWHIDKQRYASWRLDNTAGAFLARLANNGFPAGRLLGAVFIAAARATYFLPLTECREAIEHPTTYKPPGATPFDRVSPALVRRVLARPPVPVSVKGLG